ncbi:hypothetical protein PPEP_a0205 [Pseudoalteromonas peptidolytica F12-50-A1]|uniref:Uncharacterized protein n=1 Tax=Pseudoalteromonas peptidolytica F12-50-A1 TaxID=1315280 RepID=A0A8I0MT57_9GAMM|nr:hypothetical protein [Pseudoalteromonas peptidolytica F12-50-A1]
MIFHGLVSAYLAKALAVAFIYGFKVNCRTEKINGEYACNTKIANETISLCF